MTANDNVIQAQIRADVSGYLAGMKDAGGATSAATRQMSHDLEQLGHSAEHAGDGMDEFVHHVRGMRREAFLGNFMARQIEEVGIASKGAAAQVTGLVSAFAIGGGFGLAIEAAKMVAIGFHETGEEIQKANEKAEESVKALKKETDLLVLSIKGASEAEKLRFKNLVPLEEQELHQKQELFRTYAQLYRAQEQLAEAQKAGATGSDLALQQAAVEAAQGHVENAQKLLEITKKQRGEESEAIAHVADTQSEKDRQEAREKEASDNAKWRAAELLEWKKHYDAVTAETLKAMQEADKAEEVHAVRVIKASYNATEAVKKFNSDQAKARDEEIKRVDAEETRAEQNRINAAEEVGAAMGTLFLTIGQGAKQAQAGFIELTKAIISAAVKAVESYAASSAAAAYFSQAGIPVIGPILGASAAAAAGSLILGLLGNIPSAAGGWHQVPHDTLAYIHKDEQVTPKDVADPMRDFFSRGGRGGEVHLHVHALDGQDAYRFFTRPETQRALHELVRNGHWPAGG